MINLIPPSAKKSLMFEYWTRVVSVWLWLWSAALLAGTFILLPTYVLVSGQVSVYEANAAEATEKVAAYENVSIDLARASTEAKLALDNSNEKNLSDYIRAFESLEGDGVSIISVKVSRKGAEFSPVSIAGEASDRQSLASFRDRLLANDLVESVDLPISNLARDKDISFNLTVVLKEIVI
jgi:hypothetical protein